MDMLGYDTSIQRVEIEGKEQFQVTFEGLDVQGQPIVEEYLTERWLSNISAGRIVGRATRVWEVVKIDPNTRQPTDDRKVLKDSWVECNRVREGARYRAINKWFRENPAHANLSRYFLTFHADSLLKRGDIADSTFDSIRRGLVPTPESDIVADFENDNLMTA
jgi:hypothetical protein